MTAPMSTATGPTAPPTPPRDRRAVPVLVDIAVVAAWFGGAGLIGAWVWSAITTLPEVTKAGNNATMAPEELVKQVAIDGWFAVIALVGGVLSGALLLAWRRRDPLLTMALVALGSGLASWLMIQVGRLLGPDDELAALRRLPDGSQVSEQLQLHAPGVAWVWPIAAAFGGLLYLWVLAKPGGDHREPDNLR
jgi:hypothetical protein